MSKSVHASTVASACSPACGKARLPVHDPLRAEDDARIRSVLYRTFITEARHDLRATASRMGLPYSTLHSYCAGDRRFPRHRWRQLWAATRDVRLIAELFDFGAEGIALVELPAGVTAAEVRSQAIRAVSATSAMAAAVDASLDPAGEHGARVSPGEKRRVDLLREAAHRELEATASAVDALEREGGER